MAAHPQRTGHDADAPKRERLQRVLADAGIAARRVCERMIAEGRVVVNGHRMTELPIFVNPHEDQILVDGKPIPPPQQPVYIALHKPARTIVATADEPGLERRTVLDLIDHPARSRLFPVGRLDYDTTGLLLLTNDGDFANAVTHPSRGVPKVYHAWVKGFVHDDTLAKVRRQSKLVAKAAQAEKRRAAREAMGSWAKEDAPGPRKRVPISPIEARVLRFEDGKSVLEVELVDTRAPLRDVLLSAGLDVRKLVRVRIGSVDVKGLQPAFWRELHAKEVKALMTWRVGRSALRVDDKTGRKKPAPAGAKGAETGRGGVKTPTSRGEASPVEQAAQRALRALAGQPTPRKPGARVTSEAEPTAGSKRKPRTLLPE